MTVVFKQRVIFWKLR